MTAAVPPLPPRDRPAHRITSEVEAIDTAHRLAAAFATGAAARDRDRRLPFAEVERYSQSGLWGISIPRSHGGAGVSHAVLAETTAIIAAADGSLGQIPQNHYFLLEVLRWGGTEAQKRFFYDRVLDGDRLGNALAEFDTPDASERRIRIEAGDEGLSVTGRKFYCSGVIFAHWIVPMVKQADGEPVLAFIPRDTAGLAIHDDWDSFGQRTTASGTTLFDRVPVAATAVVPVRPPGGPGLPLPLAQIIHAAIDAGIARAALADTLTFVRDQARPWIDSGVPRAAEDPLTLTEIGQLSARVHGADALLDRAGRLLDIAAADPTPARVAEATVAVYEAKALAIEAALATATKLFELAGTRATFREHNLDRHWRNVRTHSLHDPVRWRLHAVGNHLMNGVPPPNTFVRPQP